MALSQGRYKWPHDKVLKELAAAVQGMINENKNRYDEVKKKIIFIKAGEKIEAKKSIQQESTLTSAKDW